MIGEMTLIVFSSENLHWLDCYPTSDYGDSLSWRMMKPDVEGARRKKTAEKDAHMQGTLIKVSKPFTL